METSRRDKHISQEEEMQTMNGKSMHGQSLVLIALMMIGLVAFVGLALDGGQVYEMRRQTQNAADAAALAAVDEIAMGQNALVYYRISQYAIGNSTVGNGASGFAAEYYNESQKYYSSRVPVVPGLGPPLGTDCVKVTANKTFNTLIISFLGFNNLTVSASASGCVRYVIHPTTALWPMAIFDQGFAKNTTYNLYGDGNAAPNQFGWLSYDGFQASSDLWPKLQNSYLGPFQVYTTNPCDGSGQTNIPSMNAMNCIKTGPFVKPTDQSPAASQLGQIVVVGVYDSVQGSGANKYYHVIGFGAFKILAVCLQGGGQGDCAGTNGKNIKGQFVNKVITGQGVCNPDVQDCGPDWGLKVIKLSQ